MNAPFFITGLPRSRTCWLANLLTTDRSLCLHDGTRGVHNAHEFLEKLTPTSDRPWMGSCGSDLMFYAREIGELSPEARWIIIKRPAKDALASFMQAFHGQFSVDEVFESWARHEAALLELPARLKHQPLVVQFDALERESAMRAIWAHCLPGVPFDFARWRLLNNWNVQFDIRKLPLKKEEVTWR